ncbi:hypothetical protein [Thermococcus sp.]|uniref:hypothetical protein n=1 Tax=Thermococcus sp. TaxID=35749 RepID=UPI0026348614|nr:hypothetical protein [Thermococcus sp.]
MNYSALIGSIHRNGVLTVIARGAESNGDLLGIKLLKELLKLKEPIFVALYEPLLVFRSNLANEGIMLEDVLGDDFWILDVFGNFKGIERDIPHVYQMSGYLDDGVFVSKYGEMMKGLSKSLSSERVWFFSYLSSGACKLFSMPRRTYQIIWNLKMEVEEYLPDIRSVLVYDSADCPELEDYIYTISDVVVEAVKRGTRRLAYITKGGEAVFDPFGGE